MGSRSFPRWSAPFVGICAGACIGLRCAGRQNGLPIGAAVAIFAALGFAGGLIVLVLDPAKPKRRTVKLDAFEEVERQLRGQRIETETDEAAANGHSVVGRFLAILSIALFFMPLVGLGLPVLSLFVNRRVSGWPRAISIVALVLAVVVTVVSIVAIIIDRAR